MNLTTKLALVLLATLSIPQIARAAYPDDLSDVIFIESPDVKNWPITTQLSVSAGGGTITMDYDKKNSWPISSRLGGCCVANAWGIIMINGIPHAGTWEYLRPGQIVKQETAFGGCCHFRGPIGNFNRVSGEVYGFMVSGVARDNLDGNNIRERSNVIVFRWGVGTIGSIDTIGNETASVAAPTPAIQLLLED